MEVAPNSNFFGRTVAEAGLDRLPCVFLVSIDRPNDARQTNGSKMTSYPNVASDVFASSDPEADATSIRTIDPVFTTVTPDTPWRCFVVCWRCSICG
jgi:hypothetical protein